MLHCLNRVCSHIVWFHRRERKNENGIDIHVKSVFQYNLTFAYAAQQVTYGSAIPYPGHFFSLVNLPKHKVYLVLRSL